MKEATVVIAGVMLGIIGVTWAVERVVDRLHDLLTAVNAVIVRACLAAIFSLIATGIAMHGGYGWIVVPLLGLLALWNVVLAGAAIWVWVSEGVSEPESAP